MGTTVADGLYFASIISEKKYRLVQQCALEKLVGLDFAIPRGHIPRVSQKWALHVLSRSHLIQVLRKKKPRNSLLVQSGSQHFGGRCSRGVRRRFFEGARGALLGSSTRGYVYAKVRRDGRSREMVFFVEINRRGRLMLHCSTFPVTSHTALSLACSGNSRAHRRLQRLKARTADSGSPVHWFQARALNEFGPDASPWRCAAVAPGTLGLMS